MTNKQHNEAVLATVEPAKYNGPLAYRYLALKGALRLQTMGLHRSGGRDSALTIIKKDTGLKARTAKEMLAPYTLWLVKRGYLILPETPTATPTMRES